MVSLVTLCMACLLNFSITGGWVGLSHFVCRICGLFPACSGGGVTWVLRKADKKVLK
jgi:hypothetical protein